MNPGNAAPSPAQVAQNNVQMRSMLLSTGIRYRKNLGAFVASGLGTTTRVKLFNVGITTSLHAYVTFPVTIATTIQVPSARAPYNLISRIKVTDYDGTDRTNISGLQMFLLDCLRYPLVYGYNNAVASQAGTGLVVNPSLPTAIGTGTIAFYLDIPVAQNDNEADGFRQDLTGAVYSQTGVGDFYLSIDWNNVMVSSANVEAVYITASGTVVANGVTGPQIQVWQNYILPQPVATPKGQAYLPIPGLDLISVYELNGNFRSTDNIAIGQEKLINFPNVRKVLQCLINYIQNGTMNPGTDLTQWRLIVNGNNIIKEWNPVSSQILEQRVNEGCDIWPGFYFWNFMNPIQTSIYGNVQMGVIPSAVTNSPYFEILFVSTYTKGAALPGMAQAG